MDTLSINPNIITWAIERAGLELDVFLNRFPKVKKWVDKEKNPTLKQLEDFSRRVHIPFGYLFLPDPPCIGLPFPFFRTQSNSQEYISLEVCDTVSIIKQRQEWLKHYLMSMDARPLGFVGKYKNATTKDVVNSIRETLNLPENWAMGFNSWQSALDGLAKKIEDSGIIITFNGVVGNNTHRRIKVEDCRGFVLADEIVPFMFINNADSKSAQMFTIAHELAHIWVGSTEGLILGS